MKENAAINEFFNRFSTNHNRWILLVMGCLLLVSMIMSINDRWTIERKSIGNSLLDTSQIIKEIIEEMPKSYPDDLERINHIKGALIQLELLNQTPVLTPTDSLHYQKILSELKRMGMHIQ